MIVVTTQDIERAYRALDFERARGDKLSEELAEAALNDTLDRFNRQGPVSHLSHVTTKEQHEP